MAKKSAGRPPMYKTPEEMQTKIDAYFESIKGEPLCDGDGMPMYGKDGQPILIGEKPPTITGLALALGFTSRQALLNYQAKARFVDTVTRAKSRVEEYAESRLYDRDGARGAEFILGHNFGWGKEDQQSQQAGGGVIIIPAALPMDEKEDEDDGDDR